MHSENFNELIKRDKTSATDVERLAMFKVFSNDDLFQNVHALYDFKEHSIKPESLENGEVDLSSSSLRLVKLAYNLFNGYQAADVLDTFAGLDEYNFELCIEAIRIRFNQ